MMTSSKPIFCEQALLPSGWAKNVCLHIGTDGSLTRVEQNVPFRPYYTRVHGPLVPALANLHSHAFQRAMAGLAEIAGSGDDSFWTWRSTMYRLVATLSPSDIQAIAAKLYSELLKGGFGRVVEFHYLHHRNGGERYSNPAETSFRILAAAQEAGIGLTHLPVFYAHSTFGGAAPGEGQLPFVHTVDEFLSLLDGLRRPFADAGALLGTAIHSLRAATPDEMRQLLSSGPASGPIHIHVAEQEREVEECLAWSGRRPVEWLLDEMPVDSRWCAIHATHMTDEEIDRLARSGAVAGLCPATEANLGDGLFPATQFLKQGGRFGIGTDSHVATSVSEELRLLEYGQRLRDRRRNRLAAGSGSSVGRTIFDAALTGGAQASGIPTAGLRVGARADLVVLDGDNPFIAAASEDQILDRWLFALGPNVVRDVMVAGRWVVSDGRHEQEEKINDAFRNVLLKLR